MMLSQINSVFLADDDEDDCLLFKEALAEVALNVKLTILNNGEQLMKWLNIVPGSVPDIIFLDLNMPRKNGFECLAEIKRNKQLKGLAVIILSTSLQNEVADRLYKNGADYYIKKPSTVEALKKVILLAIKTVQKDTSSGNSVQPHKENFVLS